MKVVILICLQNLDTQFNDAPASPLVVFLLSKIVDFWPPLPPTSEEASFMDGPNLKFKS